MVGTEEACEREKREYFFLWEKENARRHIFFSMRGVIRTKKNGYTRVVCKREGKEPFFSYERRGTREGYHSQKTSLRDIYFFGKQARKLP